MDLIELEGTVLSAGNSSDYSAEVEFVEVMKPELFSDINVESNSPSANTPSFRSDASK